MEQISRQPDLAKQIELVKSWGFQQVSSNQFMRHAPAGFAEFWSPNKPDFIDFFEEGVGFSHDYFINWSKFQK